MSDLHYAWIVFVLASKASTFVLFAFTPKCCLLTIEAATNNFYSLRFYTTEVRTPIYHTNRGLFKMSGNQLNRVQKS